MKPIQAVLFTLLAAGLFAAPKETPPAGTAPKPFHLPPTEDFTLPNGMKVTIVPYGVVPKIAVRAYVSAGGVYEPESQVWISRLTAALMKEGTATRSAEQVAQEAAAMGGQFDVAAGPEYAIADSVVLSEFAPKFIELLADVLQHPALPASDLARLKADLERELAVSTSRPNSQARERFLQVLFPNHPYGRVFPKEAALKAYTLENVQGFYKANFAASRTHLYIAGKLVPGLKKTVTDAFGKWSKGTAPVDIPATPVKARSLSVIDRPGAEQSTVFLGLPIPDPTSPDYIILDVMDSMLGSSFGSRITSNIREQKGYTYSPFSQIATRRHLAYWLESAAVTTAVTGASLKEIFYEVDRIRRESPPAQELKAIQSYLAGLFVLKNTASPNAVISQLFFVDSQGLPRSFLSEYVKKVMAVTPQDIQRVSESYLIPSKMTVVVVGDQAKIADQLKPYEN